MTSDEELTQPPDWAGVESSWQPLPLTERRDALANRQQILAAARRLFAERGVAAVTMQQIAQAAGVGQGTLYRRYASKGQLCAALLGEQVFSLQQEVSGWRNEAAPAFAILDRLLLRLADFNEANGPLLAAMTEGANEAAGGYYHSPMYDWLHKVVAGLLAHAVAVGECASLDPEATADVLLATLLIDLYRFQRSERGFSQQRIVAASQRLLAGLRC